MESTHDESAHRARREVGNEEDGCDTEDGDAVGKEAPFYVLRHSREEGTHAWPCDGLDAAVETLARLARTAEEDRRRDRIQRYFCIQGETPEGGDATRSGAPVPDPRRPDDSALTLVLHLTEDTVLRVGSDTHRLCLRITGREEAERMPVGLTTPLPLAAVSRFLPGALRPHKTRACGCGCDGQAGCTKTAEQEAGR